jgi:hypothetical protein
MFSKQFWKKRNRRNRPQSTVLPIARQSDENVYRTKRRFVLGNLKAALSEEPRPGAKRKLSGKEQALLDRLFQATRRAGALDAGTLGR